MALPMPWKALKAINIEVETEMPHRREEIVNRRMPQPKIRLLPRMSPSLPKGTRQTADARRKDMGIQLRSTASMVNSFAMEGRAMLTEDPMKGTIKEVRDATTRAARLVPGSPMIGFYTISCKNRNPAVFAVSPFGRSWCMGYRRSTPDSSARGSVLRDKGFFDKLRESFRIGKDRG
jgi:hypothetical protein